MGMLERSREQIRINRIFTTLILTGACIYLAVVVGVAFSLGHQGVGAKQGRIGPLKLFSLRVSEVDNRRLSSVAIEPGTIVYWLLWLGMAALAGLTVSRRGI